MYSALSGRRDHRQLGSAARQPASARSEDSGCQFRSGTLKDARVRFPIAATNGILWRRNGVRRLTCHPRAANMATKKQHRGTGGELGGCHEMVVGAPSLSQGIDPLQLMMNVIPVLT
jgi:hypothetical protein